MTQTIRTPCGRKAVWIEADYGQGRRGKPRKVEWYNITLADFLDGVELEELDEGQADALHEQLLCFAKGYAWVAADDCECAIFKTEKEARDWSYSRSC